MRKFEQISIKEILDKGQVGAVATVKGWVRTKRTSKNVAFIALNDGSTIRNIQIVIDYNQIAEESLININTGASLEVSGKLTASQGSGQSLELTAEKLIVLGIADPDEYPIQPKKHSLEFLREKAHLRFRTNTFSAVTRIRHAMIFAIHKFFTDKGFYNIHTPIITGSDCEGAGEMFRVSTLSPTNPPLNEEIGRASCRERV